jgi:hypothetical protein
LSTLGKQLSLFSGQKNQPAWLIGLIIFVVAFVPRALGLDSFIVIDEARWVYRSAFFWRAILAGNFAQASAETATPGIETLAPGVPVMWLGGLGLTAKYWTDSARPVDNLSDYLALVPRKTEKISLDFYAWTRRPFILLASLFLVSFYLLLSRLIKPTAALLAALLLAFDPFFIGLSRLVHHSVALDLTLLPEAQPKANPKDLARWLAAAVGVAGRAGISDQTDGAFLVCFCGRLSPV